MPAQCRECESELLSWGWQLDQGVVMMFLGCDECSATVKLMTLDQFLTHYHPVSIAEITE